MVIEMFMSLIVFSIVSAAFLAFVGVSIFIVIAIVLIADLFIILFDYYLSRMSNEKSCACR